MISVIFGIIMGFFHYFSEVILYKLERHSVSLLSFSAGISITYLFLILFPEFSKHAAESSKFVFLALLAGFVVFHVIEKYIYQHSPKRKRLREIAVEDSIISFIYHFIVGMILVSFANQGFSQGLLFFIPVLFFTAVNTLPVDMTKSKIVKVVLASSTLLGILFARFVYTEMSLIVYLTLLGFIVGALSFTVIRHSIPFGKKGKPLYFILGVIIYSTIIFLL